MAIVIYSVNTEQLNRVPAPTIENALQGKVPGAVITQNSGAPGGGIQLQQGGHHLAIRLRQEGTTEDIPLVKLYSTKDKGPHQWGALQELSHVAAI